MTSSLIDPRDRYPRPPFKAQQQPVPGTFQEMDPKPDHGEDSYRGSGRLEGLRALITGADSGIGRAVAIAYAREGADVAINFLPAERSDAEDTAALVEAAGRKAILLPGDIGNEQDCIDAVASTVEQLGGIDLLVMVAGQMPTVDSIEDFDTAVFDDLVRTNVHSLFWLSKAAVPHLAPGSSIITTSSVQGFQPSPSLIEYAVTKAGIVNFTRGLAAQLADRGIRVTGVAPGPFWTPLQPASVPNEKIENFGEQVPLGRPGQPAELASTYVYLASADASYTSGETIVVSGGNTTH